MKRHPPRRRLAGRAQEVDVVAVIDERADQTCRRALDAAVEDEWPRDDQELHEGDFSWSRSGNRIERATRKL